VVTGAVCVMLLSPAPTGRATPAGPITLAGTPASSAAGTGAGIADASAVIFRGQAPLICPTSECPDATDRARICLLNDLVDIDGRVGSCVRRHAEFVPMGPASLSHRVHPASSARRPNSGAPLLDE